jgi:quercetin dioxygenase-like cupin family protein
MLVKKVTDVPLEPVQEGVGIRWLIAEKDGAPNFAMRLIEFEPGVNFPPHHHPYEHEIYVLEGQGMVTSPAGDVDEMVPGTALLIPSDEVHGYRNTGDVPLKFICVIPLQS